jgi:iron(III) transport system permease protein
MTSPGLIHKLVRRGSFQPWLVGLIIIATLLAIPVFCILLSVFLDSGDVWRHLYETVLVSYIINSLTLVSGVGFLVLSLGIIPAWLVTMYKFPGSKVLSWALLLPMAIPAYIIAYTYTGMLDVAGPLQMMLRDYFGWEYGDYWFPEVRSHYACLKYPGPWVVDLSDLFSRWRFRWRDQRLLPGCHW